MSENEDKCVSMSERLKMTGKTRKYIVVKQRSIESNLIADFAE